MSKRLVFDSFTDDTVREILWRFLRPGGSVFVCPLPATDVHLNKIDVTQLPESVAVKTNRKVATGAKNAPSDFPTCVTPDRDEAALLVDVAYAQKPDDPPPPSQSLQLFYCTPQSLG